MKLSLPSPSLFLSLILAQTYLPNASAIDQGIPVQDTEHQAVVGYRIREDLTSAAFGTPTETSICTGFLVHAELILTSAHCLKNARSIENLSNASLLGKPSKGAPRLEIEKFNSHPRFTFPSRGMNAWQSFSSSFNDVAYIRLKKPENDIQSLKIHVSDGETANRDFFWKEMTVVGFGANEFRPRGDYMTSRRTKNRGTLSTDSSIYPHAFVFEKPKKFGLLPGDSGGPVLLEFPDGPRVIGIAHSMSPAIDATTKKVVYGNSTVTLLTRENICWIEKDSGIRISEADCAHPELTATRD